MEPAWFFRDVAEWDSWERELLGSVERGPVLDLGAGAGRASLYFQARGFEATAVESSPGAAAVCRRRGVRDVREVDLNEPPSDRAWGAVLLLCGNLGLGGSWDGNRRLLGRLSEICAPDAVLIGDSVEHDGPMEVGLRIRYGELVSPWWRQRNVSPAEVTGLIEDTGWRLERHLIEGVDHAVLLVNERGR
jgi:SAM-dependent methyltransferase